MDSSAFMRSLLRRFCGRRGPDDDPPRRRSRRQRAGDGGHGREVCRWIASAAARRGPRPSVL